MKLTWPQVAFAAVIAAAILGGLLAGSHIMQAAFTASSCTAG